MLEKLAMVGDVLPPLVRAARAGMKQSHMQAVLDFLAKAPSAGRLFAKKQLLEDESHRRRDWKAVADEWKMRKDDLYEVVGGHRATVEAAMILAKTGGDGPGLAKPPDLTEFLAEVMRVQLRCHRYYSRPDTCDAYVLSRYMRTLHSMHESITKELEGMSSEDKSTACRMLSLQLCLPAITFNSSSGCALHPRHGLPSCEQCLALAKASFEKEAGESGRLPWFPCPAEAVGIATDLKNMAPQINYLLHHMRSESWDPDLIAREILFKEKIFCKSFFEKLRGCEDCTQVLKLALVEEEKQKCQA
ncbi:unnamed protein product, partial [Symbiodinium necroappetens]